MSELSEAAPSVFETAAQRMYASFHEQAAASGQAPAPYDYVPWGESQVVTEFWLAIARAGLVPEDGEQ